MRTITLELLRHGPAHNQLLSPLTPYLALCEDHEAVTLQVKLEHRSLLHQLRALSYQLGDETRRHQVQDSARFLAELLAQVPGLAAELNRSASNGPLSQPIHLRLVLSASELALLPFELALAPPTWPGAGQPLLLQPQQALCITRESRRVAGPALAWPGNTRLLVVLASPVGLPAVPDLAHLVALRACLAPWIASAAERDQHLTVLTDASLLDVQRACARHDYSHVHILAHGGERRDGADTRYGLMLHDPADPSGPADVVSGERLASALRPVRQASRGEASPGAAHCPAVVTLASCNSGAVGGVTGLGASIAHALHQAGIPLVIASQFPLSFGGSVRMVQTLYDGLLWGDDPRAVLVDLRRQLHTEFPDTADWASLTAYASLPADFEAALADSQVQRAMTAINAAMKAFEAAVLSDSGPAPDQASAAVTAAISQLQGAKARLRLPADVTTPTPLERARRLRVLKLQASTAKREAGLSQVQAERSAGAAQARHLAAMWQKLDQARQLYFDCYHEERTPYFTTQYLSLEVVRRWAGRPAADQGQPGRDPAQLWDLAEVQALHDARHAVAQERVWAHGTLAELYLLALAIPGVAGRERDWLALAVSQARQLAAGVAGGTFELLSTRRQFRRYGKWYAGLCAQPPAWQGPLLAIAQAVVAELPALDDADWDYARG